MILLSGKPVVAGVGDNILLVMYTSIFITGIGYWSYFKAIKLSDAATGSLAFLLKPAIAPVIAVIFLRENILWNTVVGILLILFASGLNFRFQKVKK